MDYLFLRPFATSQFLNMGEWRQLECTALLAQGARVLVVQLVGTPAVLGIPGVFRFLMTLR